MIRERSILAILVVGCLLGTAAADGQMSATMDTANMLASPTLPPEGRKAIQERIEAVHARFREAHGGQGPEQFGTQCCQITQIPAAAFQEMSVGGHWWESDNGYVYPVSTSGTTMWAPVQLPSGAEIQYFNLFHCDTDATLNITAQLWAYSGGGISSGLPADALLETTASSGTPGCTYTLGGPFPTYTVNNNVGYDPAAAQLAVVVGSAAVGQSNQFKAVDLWWMRQISPAPSVASFADVPTNHFFFQFIEALYDSRITQGCDAGPPRIYCPDANVTRAEMAAFFARALGLYWRY